MDPIEYAKLSETLKKYGVTAPPLPSPYEPIDPCIVEKMMVRMNRQMRIVRAVGISTAAVVGAFLCFALPVNGVVVWFATYASVGLAGMATTWYLIRRDRRNALAESGANSGSD